MKIIGILIFTIFFSNINAESHEQHIKSKNSLPYFRRRVEEITEEPSVALTDDPHSKLVSFLVKNVREIFGDVYNDHPAIKADNRKTEPTEFHESTFMFRPTIENRVFGERMLSKLANSNLVTDNDDVTLHENLTLTPLPFSIDKKHAKAKPTQVIEELTEKVELIHLSKDLMLLGRADSKELSSNVTTGMFDGSTDTSELKRSCIFCNSVAFDDCVEPKNKLVPSIMCEKEEDLCYSQHTPFGIVERGCYNVNLNISTYVCACNLCNYLSIGEMPALFVKQKNWVDNVIELSHTTHFRKSVFKDMFCLKCEVNTTSERKVDVMNDANCLEGNVGSLPTQECKQNEICGMRVLRNNGYVWRGCVRKPLYNYWLTLCDSDLCNYDPIASVYDTL